MEHDDQATMPIPGALPQVQPPTAGFIVQLFLIPALIVVGIVTVWLLFGKVAESQLDPQEFLRDLKSTNREHRWRGARRLASLLPNNPKLQSDPILNEGLGTLFADKLNSNPATLPEEEVNLLTFVGIALSQMEGGDKSLALALAPDVPAPLQHVAVLGLGQIASNRQIELDESTRAALVVCGQSNDVEVRKAVANCLGTWSLTAATTEALTALAMDPDYEVRCNAAAALVRQGSVIGLPVVLEMLDPERLEQVPAAVRESMPLAAIAALEGIQPRPAGDEWSDVGPMLLKLESSSGVSGTVRLKSKNLRLTWEESTP